MLNGERMEEINDFKYFGSGEKSNWVPGTHDESKDSGLVSEKRDCVRELLCRQSLMQMRHEHGMKVIDPRYRQWK